MSERLKEMVSKTIELVRVPGVRIPPAPNVVRCRRGFETERDCENAKATALKKNAAQGRAVSAQAGRREQTGSLRTETESPLLRW